MMKHKILKTALALCLLFAGTAFAEQEKQSDCGRRVDRFSYLVDYSRSMMESPLEDEQAQKEKRMQQKNAAEEIKAEIEKSGIMKLEEYEKTKRIISVKKLINAINERIPLAEYQSGLYTAAPYTTILPYAQYEAPDFSKGVAKIKNNMEVLGRRSSLGFGIEKHGDALAAAHLDGTVFLLTDGAVNRGRKIAQANEKQLEADESDGKIIALEKFYADNPRARIVVISLADTEEGKRTTERLASVGQNSAKADLRDLLTDNRSLNKFIADNLYKKCCNKKKKPDVLSIHGINFAFDEYTIDAASEKILQDALKYIEAQPAAVKFTIQGWTDWMGADEYNAVLSLNRARAVKQWLAEHGVEEERMTVQGMGKSFKNDNRTAEGRWLNRRVDFIFE